MTRHVLAAVVLCAATIHVNAAAAPSAAAMYADARAREDAIRAAWTRAERGSASTPTLAQARAVIAAYRAIVRRYPRSGYSDNALYQAAGLAAETHTRFSTAGERNLASMLLRTLIQEYPASSLVPAARILLGDLQASAAAARPAPGTVPGADDPPDSPSPPGSATILSIARTALPDGVRITLELDRAAVHQYERIGDPDRLFIDFAGTRTTAALRSATVAQGDDLVRQVRTGYHPNATTRVVLDLEPGTSVHVSTLTDPYRVVIDCRRGAAEASPPPPLPARPQGPRWAELPFLAGSALLPAAVAPDTPPVPAEVPPPPAPPGDALPARPTPTVLERPPHGPTGSLGTGVSMARQLGLGIARIVIDPGHGGHDPGAKTRATTEARVVLDIALRLEKLLLQEPGIEVVLTRRTDVFVPLEARTAIANRVQADLFISIHANASRNTKANGIETYLLDFASTPDAAAVAARENASSGIPISNLPEIVKAITLTNKLDESRSLATQVQQALYRQVRPLNRTVRNLGVKRAPFVVLIGATMPSVLVEVSFLTNPREGQLLNGAGYRQRIAEALFEGLQKYQRALNGAIIVANQ